MKTLSKLNQTSGQLQTPVQVKFLKEGNFLIPLAFLRWLPQFHALNVHSLYSCLMHNLQINSHHLAKERWRELRTILASGLTVPLLTTIIHHQLRVQEKTRRRADRSVGRRSWNILWRRREADFYPMRDQMELTGECESKKPFGREQWVTTPITFFGSRCWVWFLILLTESRVRS